MVYLGCSEEDGQERSNNVLVLQGPQTIGKTSWLENLLPKKMRNDYFLGGRALDLNNKDHIMETLSNWLVELGEIESTFRKSDQEMLKNFITAKKDRYRPPYHAESIDKKRRTSLSSTTNDYSYLRDVTGNRRYLTIPCKDVNYEHNLDLDMLWGYFYSKYLKGEQYWFSKDENRQISKTNEEFLNKPDWFMLIEEVFIINDKDYNKENWMKAKDAYEKLSLDEKSIIKNHLALGKKFSSMAVEKRVTNGVTFYNVHPKWKNV
jgi:predicted P-loop ATPase